MRALVVDLNNFSRYPTVAVGLIARLLRDAEIRVDVLSPFALGVHGYPRVTRPPPWGLLDEGLRYWTATTPSPWIRRLRRGIESVARPPRASNHAPILGAVDEGLDAGAEIVLISAYTMYEDLCAKICARAARRGVPVLVGGNYFSEREIVEPWLAFEGLSAIFGGEPEDRLVDLVETLVAGGDVSAFPGVSVPGRPASETAPPLNDLDAVPFADYSDFPWHRYPNRIIPMMTGRGCGWGACRFCGDVVTSAGRRFRSRSPDHVLDEMLHQHRAHDANLFTFLDLKLNSNRAVWKTISEKARSVVPDAQWTASIHIDARANDALDAYDLQEARRGGLIRMTTGLESGSRRVLDAMAKGTDPDRTSQVLHDAHGAGISIRLTVLIGYPGETPDDVDATRRFLERHRHLVDRVVVNRLALMLGSTLDRERRADPERYAMLRHPTLNTATAIVEHENATFLDRHHRRAVWRLLRTVHRINRKPLSDVAREFEGVM